MLKTLDNLQTNLKNKTIILRTDYNVPFDKNKKTITDDLRIQKSLPTIKELLKKNAKIIILTHLGRPKGKTDPNLRLDKIAEHLGKLLNINIQKSNDVFEKDSLNKINTLKEGQILLIENIRFHPGEKENSPELFHKIAKYADFYVNDAFGAAHRNHASTFGITTLLPSYAGRLMETEINALAPLLQANIQKPLTMIFGGAKIDTKIGVIENFIEKADHILIGGAIANTFLAANNQAIGQSLYEEDKIPTAKEILRRAKNKIILPKDLITANEISKEAKAHIRTPDQISETEKIFDIGPQTIAEFTKIIQQSKTIIFNGPLGLYEFPQFENGTKEISKAIAQTQAKSIIGGGDTADAIRKFNFNEKDFTHISTGGGACIEFLSGLPLQAIQALEA